MGLVQRTVLVMWEWTCEHSPIWGAGPDAEGGLLDARDLGLPEALRDDLADWNRRCEAAADDFGDEPSPAGPREWRELGAEAFRLAARVQRGLGDEWTVWCLAGGGDGGMRDPGAFAYTRRTDGPQLLLDGSGVRSWTPDGTEPALDRYGATLRREAEAVRSGTAEERAAALETAARLHASLASGRILWFGGADVPE